jgi:hypothetical protein
VQIGLSVVSPSLDATPDQPDSQPGNGGTEEHTRDVEANVEQPVESMQLPITHGVRSRDALQEEKGVHRRKVDAAPPDGQRNGLRCIGLERPGAVSK